MAPFVYILGVLISAACSLLLLRGYARGKKKLLLWSGLCFLGLAISNLLVFADLVLLPNLDLYLFRLATAALSMGLLVYGLIWENR
ncbi:MAG TPA: DUF5985 family protein [Terriglobales bacterium]|jgi:hypothetical protein